MRFAVYSSLLVGILAAGCAPAAPERTAPPANRAADEQALRDLDARWLKAAQSRDAAAEAALFASDGVAYRSVGTMRGPAAIEAGFQKDYADNPNSRTTWTTDTLQIAEAGDIAYQTGEVHVTGLGAKGDGEDRLRFLTVWKKVNGEWKVAHDMSSSVAPKPATP